MDEGACLRRLDSWTEYTRQFTEKGMELFRANPAAYQNSELHFRMCCLVTALKRDMGLRYNPEKIPIHVPLECPDSFIHGALMGAGGTCASLPVVYIAVGRRLGYPLKLVYTVSKSRQTGHYFVRWDDPNGSRFNIEATARGFASDSDDHYRTGRFELPPLVEEKGCLLRSMTPRQELSHFMRMRAYYLKEAGSHRMAMNACAWAYALYPEDRILHNTVVTYNHEWHEQVKRRIPPGFPRLFGGIVTHRFPSTLPEPVESDIYYLELVENLLNTTDFDAKWWEPLRQGQSVPSLPQRIEARFYAEGMNLSLVEPPKGMCNIIAACPIPAAIPEIHVGISLPAKAKNQGM